MDTKEIVLKILTDSQKPMRPAEIAEAAQLESKEVSKYIKELRQEEKVYSPKRCYYQAT